MQSHKFYHIQEVTTSGEEQLWTTLAIFGLAGDRTYTTSLIIANEMLNKLTRDNPDKRFVLLSNTEEEE